MDMVTAATEWASRDRNASEHKTYPMKASSDTSAATCTTASRADDHTNQQRREAMSEILKPLGQWDTALDKYGRVWVSVDGEGWRFAGLSAESGTWTPSRAAEHNLVRTPLGAELERLRDENHHYNLGIGASIRDADSEHTSEYVTRDELAEKLDEVYQAIHDAAAYGPEYGAAPERPMPGRPPIPSEPTGFGAIVRDADGDHWARTQEGRWLALVPGGGKRTWESVAMHRPLTVVFEGVES